MYPEEISDSLANFKEMLDFSGYAYILLPIAKKETGREANAEEMNIFTGCACLVPIFSKDFFNTDNIYQKSQFWYYIGLIKSNSKSCVVPMCLEKGVSLSGTPIQTLDIMFDAESLMNTLSSRLSSKLIRYNYYENYSTNKFASKRIYHRNFHLKFKIYQTSFENAKKYYRYFEERRVSDSTFDEFIAENIVCGCRVISFGQDEHLPPPIMPYKNEVHPYVTDYPKVLVGKKSYLLFPENEIEKTGIRAELTLDVIMPVHKLLGTYFKCYLSSKDETLSPFVLAALFEGDFTKGESSDRDICEDVSEWYDAYPDETYIDTESNRLYFTTGMHSNFVINAKKEHKVGEILDYVYPQ
jgi:hypothetical protein